MILPKAAALRCARMVVGGNVYAWCDCGGVLDVLPEGTTSDTDLFFRLL